MESPPSNQPAPSATESWELARNYSGLLGSVPSPFATTIRMLLLDEKRSAGIMSPVSRFLIVRLLKGPSIKAAVYFSALTFHEERITTLPYVPAEALVALYRPLDLAVVTGMVYLYRRVRKICDKDEFVHINNALERSIEVGGHLGIAIPTIGFAHGLVSGGIQQLALGTFLHHDKKGYVEYRRHLKSKGFTYDESFELARWGCTSAQVGAVLLQALGFGVGLANAFGGQKASEDAPDEKEAYIFKIAGLWCETLIKTGAPPNIVHKGEFYPAQESLKKLLDKVTVVRNQGSRHSWLSKGKKDVSRTATPQLYPPAGSEGEAKTAADMPADLKNQLTPEELKNFESSVQELGKEE